MRAEKKSLCAAQEPSAGASRVNGSTHCTRKNKARSTKPKGRKNGGYEMPKAVESALTGGEDISWCGNLWTRGARNGLACIGSIAALVLLLASLVLLLGTYVNAGATPELEPSSPPAASSPFGPPSSPPTLPPFSPKAPPYIPCPASPPPSPSPSIPPEDVDALRIRVARASVKLLPGQSRARTQAGHAERTPLVRIDDVCAVFQTAYVGAGASGVLALLERSHFLEAVKQALAATGHDSDIAVAQSPDAGCGIEYSKAGSAGQIDLLGRELPDGGRLWTASDLENKKKKCWAHGTLWWLRHWAGAFIADKAMKGDASQGAVEALILWLQEAHDMNDFVWVSALHGALYQLIAPMGVAASKSSSLRYPSQLAQRLCHDHVPNVYECRHGIGHGVFYAVLMSQVPSMSNYSACRQPRPYSMPMADQILDAATKICRTSAQIPTQNQQHTYETGCISGSTHSWYLFDAALAEYGIS